MRTDSDRAILADLLQILSGYENDPEAMRETIKQWIIHEPIRAGATLAAAIATLSGVCGACASIGFDVRRLIEGTLLDMVHSTGADDDPNIHGGEV